MSGQDSTPRKKHQKKRTVEDTLAISIYALHPHITDVQRTGRALAGRLILTLDGQPTEAVIKATFALRNDGIAVRLQYGIGDAGREFDYWVALVGKRSNLVPDVVGHWYFVCPECERLCTALYLPPDASFFACRSCRLLTYRSHQEAHKYDGLIQTTAKQLGLNEHSTRRAIYSILKGGY